MTEPSPTTETPASLSALEAFEAVFRRWYLPLVNFAYSYTRDPQQAEDIVTELFVAIWEGRNDRPIPSDPAPYLFSALRNRLTDYWRVSQGREKLRRSFSQEIQMSMTASSPPRPDAEIEAAEENAIIERSIDSLPQRYREVVVMRIRLEMPADAVAEALGISPMTVHKRMGRAVEMLKAKLRD